MSGREDCARVRATLDALIDMSGLSRRQIERCLAEQDAGVDLTRLLSGRFALKLYHLLDILEVLQVQPLEFFRMVFPAPEKRSPLIARLVTLFNPPPAKTVRP
jgi:hypothetical protein